MTQPKIRSMSATSIATLMYLNVISHVYMFVLSAPPRSISAAWCDSLPPHYYPAAVLPYLPAATDNIPQLTNFISALDLWSSETHVPTTCGVTLHTFFTILLWCLRLTSESNVAKRPKYLRAGTMEVSPFLVSEWPGLRVDHSFVKAAHSYASQHPIGMQQLSYQVQYRLPCICRPLAWSLRGSQRCD